MQETSGLNFFGLGVTSCIEQAMVFSQQLELPALLRRRYKLKLRSRCSFCHQPPGRLREVPRSQGPVPHCSFCHQPPGRLREVPRSQGPAPHKQIEGRIGGRGDAIAMSEKERPTRNWRPRPTTAAWWPYSFYSFQDCRRPHPARAAWWLKFIGPCEHNVQNQSHQFCLDIAKQTYFSKEPYVDTKRFMHQNKFFVAPQHWESNPIKQSIGPVDPCSCIHSCASRI